ncbi:hypothetical protein PFICI_13383 [Pestalotiopsis fici W106-1]|uniref:Amidohydrolase-related domain-containing protein n=1 Tax=Pestalotiopsis fici (strain W106-1 / CGMCC3.15140) TaxID=1229662 RepID=W3WMB0_PESFW|nr:uncharacterized protein PFICI_13383 [Pestalotiopsis fici W106-1]ETS74899.1 hypothetical protein PFICI_13383 [Pestalotiopsis fici W106-1]
MTLVRRRAKALWIYAIIIVFFAFCLFLARRFLPNSSFSNILFGSVSHGGCKIITKGNYDKLILKGVVLTPKGPLQDGYVLVESGKVAEVGTSYSSESQDTLITVVDCANSVISPGFINLHEHLTYSIVSPFKDLGERVSHRHDWRVGARNRTIREALVAEDMIGDSIKWGELRHLFSGTTSVVGGGMVTGLVRNLDFASGLEAGLLDAPSVWDVFPLDDADGILRNNDCDYGPEAIDRQRAEKYHRYLAHVGEGVDDEAANEFRCLSDETYDSLPMPGGGGLSTDIIAPNLAMVHALGLSASDFDLVAKRGAHIIWSPRSNMFLYGKTLNITYLLEAGINVALGTDWLPSGSATMSREAHCAALATQQLYGRHLEAKTIWEMMTINAARAASFEQHIGSLEVGKLADIVIFTESTGDVYSQAVFGSTENIEMVLRGGRVLLVGDKLGGLSSSHCEPVQIGRSRKAICIADELGLSYAEFAASLAGFYPAALPSIPPYEPLCDAIVS